MSIDRIEAGDRVRAYHVLSGECIFKCARVIGVRHRHEDPWILENLRDNNIYRVYECAVVHFIDALRSERKIKKLFKKKRRQINDK